MVLVTGGTGFLGSVLIGQLLGQGIRVRATKRATSRIPGALEGRPGLEWVDADILDFLALEEAFEGIRQVYHCAAKVSYHPAHHKAMLRINTQGTAHIVDLCLEHKARLVYVSSVAALGSSKPGEEGTEGNVWEYEKNQPAYSVSKYESEMEVWRGFSEGLDGVIVNPSLIIGQAAGIRGSGAIFYTLFKGLKFYPAGSVGVVDVEDVAKAMVSLMGRQDISGQRFVVNHVNMSYKDMLAQCSHYYGKPAPQTKASPLMMELAWRGSSLAAWMRGKKSALTKDSARLSSKQLHYSNKKLVDAVQIQFKPIQQTLKEICEGIMNRYPDTR